MLGRVTVNMKDSPARIDPEEAAIGRPTQTARRLVEASVSPNTPPSARTRLRQPRTPASPTPARSAASTLGSTAASSTTWALAAYLAELHDAGRASSSASMAVAAACFRAKLAGQPTPAGEQTARGAGRLPADRLRSGARTGAAVRGLRKSRTWRPCFATCCRPRRRGRGGESDQVAIERGRVDAVIAGLLFMAGMRRSEVSALCWVDVVDSTDGDGMTRHRATEQDEPGGRGERRAVREGRRSARPPHAAHLHESGAGRPRRAVVGADDRVAVHGRGAGRRHREPGDGALGPGRTRVGAHEPGRIDHGRDARGQLEDQPHVAHLLCRGDGGTRCSRTLSVAQVTTARWLLLLGKRALFARFKQPSAQQPTKLPIREADRRPASSTC